MTKKTLKKHAKPFQYQPYLLTSSLGHLATWNPRELFFFVATKMWHSTNKAAATPSPRCCGLPFGSRSQYPHHLTGWVGNHQPYAALGNQIPSGTYRAGPPGRCGMRIPRWWHDIFGGGLWNLYSKLHASHRHPVFSGKVDAQTKV